MKESPHTDHQSDGDTFININTHVYAHTPWPVYSLVTQTDHTGANMLPVGHT